jgi:hypothetical protein
MVMDMCKEERGKKRDDGREDEGEVGRREGRGGGGRGEREERDEETEAMPRRRESRRDSRMEAACRKPPSLKHAHKSDYGEESQTSDVTQNLDVWRNQEGGVRERKGEGD